MPESEQPTVSIRTTPERWRLNSVANEGAAGVVDVGAEVGGGVAVDVGADDVDVGVFDVGVAVAESGNVARDTENGPVGLPLVVVAHPAAAATTIASPQATRSACTWLLPPTRRRSPASTTSVVKATAGRPEGDSPRISLPRHTRVREYRGTRRTGRARGGRMEYLVTMTTHVPSGTSDEAVTDVRAREAAHSKDLAQHGVLLRLWRPPLAPGEWRTFGLFAADSDEELEKELAGMPLRIWRTDEITPLTTHPNDPAPERMTVETIPLSVHPSDPALS